MKTFFWDKVAPVMAVTFGICSLIAVIYFGVFVMFIGGIIQIVEAVKQTDISAISIAFGCARVFFTGLGTAIVFWGLFFINGLIWATIDEKQKSPRDYWSGGPPRERW